jgi:hypothetical protein
MSVPTSETTSKNPCAELLRLANICVQVDPQACLSCFDPVTFQASLPQKTSLEFYKAMADAAPSDPTFCDAANEKVCEYYTSSQFCCCQEETTAYRQCLFNEVLVPSVGLISSQCSDTCLQEKGGGDSSGDSDGGAGVIVGVIVALLILVGIFGSIYTLRNRDRDVPTRTTDEKKKSFITSFRFKMCNKRRESENTVDEEAPPPSSSSDHHSSSSSSDSSSSISSATFRAKDVKPANANIHSSDECAVRSRDFRPKQISSQNEDALNIAKRQQGSQRSGPSNISADSLDEPQPPQPKSSEEPRTTSSDREISGSSSSSAKQTSKSDVLKEKRKAIESWNAENKKCRSQNTDESYLSDEESKSGGHCSTGRKGQTSARTSDAIVQDRKKMMKMVAKLEFTKKKLESQLHEFEAQARALKLQNNSSSTKLNELVKDRAETTLRLSQLEEAKAHYEKRVRNAAADADALRKTHARDAKRIEELQALNAELSREVKLVRSMSDEFRLVKASSDSSLSKDNKVPKSRLPESGRHRLENTLVDFKGSWTHESVQAFEKWELKIKRAPGLC